MHPLFKIKLRHCLLLLSFIAGFSFHSCDNTDDDIDQIIDSGDTENIEGNYGPNLKTAWSKKLTSTHRTQSYSQVWTAFYTNGRRPDGYIDDIYGGHTTNYIYKTDQQSSTNDSKKYNREHSFPKSWWGGDTNDMYTDLYHLYPCDATANSQRSNLILGEVKTTQSWTNGYSKRGYMNIVGSGSKEIFEPNDEVKGDLARTYFYMATRYENENFSKGANYDCKYILTYSAYPFYKSWYIDLLMKWHKEDPVSAQERKRNEANYAIQKNRNPYIDYPELVDYVWGDKKTVRFYYKDTEAGKEIK